MLSFRSRTDYFEQACAVIDDPQVEIVSFDIFDTLLVRPVLEPIDLFHVIAQKAEKVNLTTDFLAVRRRAEQQARQQMKLSDPFREEPTLVAIYESFGDIAALSPQCIHELMVLELEAERKYLSTRKPLAELYQYALEKGKRIVAASDSYFSPEFIGEQAERNGFGDIDKLYVSSQAGRTKASGNLFSLMLDDLKVAPHKILHIGDNLKSDYKQPRRHGLKALHIPRAVWLFFTQSVNIDLWAEDDFVLTPDYRLMLGMVINRRFDSLQTDKWQADSRFNGDPELFGYLGLGPVFYAGAQNPPTSSRASIAELLQGASPKATQKANISEASSALRKGVSRFLADMEQCFANPLEISPRQALAPLMRMLDTPFAVDARMFDGLSVSSIFRNTCNKHRQGLSLDRRAELILLRPLLSPNPYLRLIHAAPEFFQNTKHPLLRTYSLWRRQRADLS